MYGFDDTRAGLLEQQGKFVEAAELLFNEGKHLEAIKLLFLDITEVSKKRAIFCLFEAIWAHLPLGFDHSGLLEAEAVSLFDIMRGIDIEDIPPEREPEVRPPGS